MSNSARQAGVKAHPPLSVSFLTIPTEIRVLIHQLVLNAILVTYEYVRDESRGTKVCGYVKTFEIKEPDGSMSIHQWRHDYFVYPSKIRSRTNAAKNIMLTCKLCYREGLFVLQKLGLTVKLPYLGQAGRVKAQPSVRRLCDEICVRTDNTRCGLTVSELYNLAYSLDQFHNKKKIIILSDAKVTVQQDVSDESVLQACQSALCDQKKDVALSSWVYVRNGYGRTVQVIVEVEVVRLAQDFGRNKSVAKTGRVLELWQLNHDCTMMLSKRLKGLTS